MLKGRVKPHPQRSPRRPAHVLTGLFDSPDLVTTELDDQRRFLREALGLEFDPPLTQDGLRRYDETSPNGLVDYDGDLIRAFACVLTEAVRIEVRGSYRVELAQRDPAVWAPYVVPEGVGERLLPADRYVAELLNGEVPLLSTVFVVCCQCP